MSALSASVALAGIWVAASFVLGALLARIGYCLKAPRSDRW
ncbi:hypothetical protein ACFVQ9_35345 [Streptomyces goshikiensis]